MKSFLRSTVASPKISHYDSDLGVELDLAYITPRLIVSSGPVNSYLKSFYRYPVSDFTRFLAKNHGSNWHVWDFRGEGAGYDDADVFGRVSHYPFPDHQAPTLQIIRDAVTEIDQFLKADDRNVAVLHCKAGKGRSGTLACAYLIYESHTSSETSTDGLTVDGVIALFTQRRMRELAGDGISILSQKRYLKYWYDSLHGSEAFIGSLAKFELSTLEGSISSIRFCNLSTVSWDYLKGLDFVISRYVPDAKGAKMQTEFSLNNFTKHRVHQDDRSIVIYPSISLSRGLQDLRVSISSITYHWFNMIFESLYELGAPSVDLDAGIEVALSIPWDSFDGIKGTKQRGFRAFDTLHITWELHAR